MLMGRHRGLPVSIDQAVRLKPSQYRRMKRKQKQTEMRGILKAIEEQHRQSTKTQIDEARGCIDLPFFSLERHRRTEIAATCHPRRQPSHPTQRHCRYKVHNIEEKHAILAMTLICCTDMTHRRQRSLRRWRTIQKRLPFTKPRVEERRSSSQA